MKTIRLLPLVALAAFSLLGLKLAGMMFGEGVFPTGTSLSQAQEKAVPQPQKNAKTDEQKQNNSNGNSLAAKRIGAKGPAAPKDITNLGRGDYRSKSEVILLASLAKRRVQLDKRESDIGLQLSLIKAAEKRIDERIKILKSLDAKIQHFAKKQKEQKKNEFGRLVKMYAAMKPKGAAIIFNELDKKVLLGIIKNMKPQAMSAILAAMAPVKAREITMALAGNSRKTFNSDHLEELPKINGN